MARRKKGRPINGWLVIDKPIGVGSTKVVSKARWALQAQKAGHSGTLDPLATGVLAVAFGEATKTVACAMEGLKRYRFTVRWGERRDTDDAEGAVVATSAKRPTVDEIEAALPSFVGEIMQRPPDYSAVKIDGERAYDIARDGDAPAIAERPIWVDSLSLVETPDDDHAVLDMVCGKGGYVRSIARDLGAALGAEGYVSALRRLSSGPFTLDDAIPFEKLDEFRDTDAAEAYLLPVATGLDDIPALAVSEGPAAQLRQGRAIQLTGAALVCDLTYGDQAWASLNGDPVALGVVRGGAFHPNRVFNLDVEKEPDVDHRRAQGNAH